MLRQSHEYFELKDASASDVDGNMIEDSLASYTLGGNCCMGPTDSLLVPSYWSGAPPLPLGKYG